MNIKELIANNTPFKNNNITAVKFCNIYEVISYCTVIFKFDCVTSKIIYFDQNKYSRTTSRLQNIIRDIYGR